MATKIAVVTGAYGGLGSELCRQIAAKGVKLVLVDRDQQKSETFSGELNRITPGAVLGAYGVDLANPVDIQRLCTELLAGHPRIDFLFNNAGVLTETLQFSPQGRELHFEVNTLAPLQLIDRLRPALRAAGRAMVVSTSAGIATGAKTLDWTALLKPTEFKKLYGPYVNSKQALNVITAALAAELASDGILIRTADPGPNKTRLTRGKGTPLWMRLFYSILPAPSKGARKIFDTAFASKWNDQSGIFVSGGKEVALPPALASAPFQGDFLRKCRDLVRKPEFSAVSSQP